MTHAEQTDSESSDREERIWQVTNECLRRLADGEDLTDESIVRQHPELMPELAEELQNVRVIRAARSRLERQNDTDATESTRGLRVRCPHCRGSAEVDSDSSFEDITCSCCGSQFSLVHDEARANGVSQRDSVAHFELLEQLGSGGFGTVWRARDRELDRIVAVKIPRQSHVDPVHIQMLLREARASAQLKHPNIVAVHEVGRDGDRVYIVTDLVEGMTLSRWLEDRPCSARDAAHLTERLACALHHAHDVGIVHRDLKPSNVMIDGNGEPHIMDFGLARRDTGEITMTVDGIVLGTPAYMSPEQAKGESHQADGRSDIYSLGVILFELLTGELPFRGSPTMVTQQVIHDDAPSPRKLNQSAPRDLETICLRCLEKDPGKRPPNARELADELRRFLVGQPIQSRPLGRLARAGRWCQRNPTVSVLASGLVATLAVGLVAVASQWIRADRHSAQAMRQSAELALDRGLALCEQGKVDQGLLWLARSLEVAPPNAVAMRRVTRANLAAWRNELHTVRLPLTHPCALHSLSLSSDGRRLLTGSADGVVRVWDCESGQLVDSLPTVGQLIRCLAMSPDGTRLVTGSPDIAARLWDVSSGQVVRELQGHKNGVLSAAFSPDGKYFITGAWDGGDTAQIWHTDTGEPIAELKHLHAVSSVSFSPDGQRILTASWDQTAQLWDANTKQRIGEPFPHDHWIWAAAFVEGGQRFVTGCDDGSVHLWDPDSRQRIWRMNRHSGPVRALAVSPDGQRLLTGSEDNTVRLWNVKNGDQIGPSMQHQAMVLAVEFGINHPNEVVTASLDHTACIWQLASSRRPRRTIQAPHGLLACDLSPDGRRIVSGGKDSVARVWDVATGQQIGEPLQHDGEWVVGVDFSPDSSLILTGEGGKATLRIWDTDTREIVRDFGEKTGGEPIVFSPDSSWIAHSSPQGTALFKVAGDRDSGSPIGAHDDRVLAVAFRADNAQIVTASEDRTARLWEITTGLQVGNLLPHRGPVRTVAWGSDGARILTGCDDKTARLWDAVTQTPLGVPLIHGGRVQAVAFSPSGRRLLTGSWDQTARLWDAATCKQVGPSYQHEAKVWAVGIDDSGATMMTASEDGAIQIWDITPPDVEGDVNQVILWTQVLTGLELNSDGAVEVLNSADWHRRRERLNRVAESAGVGGE